MPVPVAPAALPHDVPPAAHPAGAADHERAESASARPIAKAE
jgi:hypothetical protein